MLDKHSKKEHHEKRFGITAIDKGFITPDELVEALRVQVLEDIEYENHRLIGQILLAQEKITIEQTEEVLKVLFRR